MAKESSTERFGRKLMEELDEGVRDQLERAGVSEHHLVSWYHALDRDKDLLMERLEEVADDPTIVDFVESIRAMVYNLRNQISIYQEIKLGVVQDTVLGEGDEKSLSEAEARLEEVRTDGRSDG